MKKVEKSLKVMGLSIVFGALSVAAQAEDFSPAKTFQTICLQCHAKDGMGKARKNPKTGAPMVNAMMGPQIAGLSEKYISEQTKAIKAGTRKNANTVSMKQKISKLTDEQLDQMAKYVSKELNPAAGTHTGMLEGEAAK